MSFLETVRQVRDHLREAGRVSVKALKREFGLDDDALEELIEELVQVQRVAVQDQNILVWAGEAASPASPAPSPPERDPRSYTPKHLADKILQSKSALEGERKQVTVLFADVKGSMELAEQVDPEEWHCILDRFFQILTDGVHRFEGTVNQYTGDGIMALFGAPLAHEDHAQRACWAALYLRDELRRYADELRVERGLNFGTRIGVNSGEVVVGRIGDDLRMDYTAQGHTVGLAQRMEHLAASDKVYLAQSTARLVEGFFQVRSLGESTIQGVTEPVSIYELENAGPARTRLDAARLRGFTRFVGRHDEMASLEAALQRAVEGHGQVVGVVGEAGVGKSRLCAQFAENCRAKGTRVLEAHCPAYGKAVPLVPILELLRDFFAITGQDSDQLAREKIAGRLLLLDEAFRETLPLLFDFLGVPDPARPSPQIDPEAVQQQLFASIRRLVHTRSEREVAVLFLDDLHWIDEASDEFLAQLVEVTGSTRTLLLVNFRPDYAADWASRSYYQQLPLTPLGPEEVAEMLVDLLGSDDSVASLPALIQEKTGGNPFFTEEVVLSLVESGALQGERGAYRLVRCIEDLQVPASVQALVAARIDRLPEREKQVVHTAAVIGREFSEPLLSAVVDLSAEELASSLSRLQWAEFIVERSIYPVAEYAFKHPVTEQVARESQLKDRRRRVHAVVARAIEETNPEKLDDQAALLAHHWEEAGERLASARWSRRAAYRAQRHDTAQAVHHWQKVRSLVKDLGELPEANRLAVTACSQLLNLGWQQGLTETDAAALYDAGRNQAVRLGDVRAEAMLVATYGRLRRTVSGGDEYVDYVTEAAQLAKQTDDLGLYVALQSMLGQAYTFTGTGRLRESLAVIEDNLARVEGDRQLGARYLGFSPYVWLVCMRGGALAWMGRLGEAGHDLDRAAQLAADEQDPFLRATVNADYVFLAWLRGDAVAAMDHARMGIQIADQIGSPYFLVHCYGVLGLAHLMREKWSDAIDILEQALAIARSRQADLESEGRMLGHLADAYLRHGQESRARATAERAVAVSRQRQIRLSECLAQFSMTRVLLHTDGLGSENQVGSALTRAEALVVESGANALAPLIHLERAQISRLRRDTATAEHHLREAHHLYAEMGATGHAERLARELGL